MTNEWQPIKDFDSYYVHETEGVARKNKKGDFKKLKGRAWHGYPKVTLMRDGQKFEKRIHRVVGETFIANPKSLPILNHKNSNRSDYRKANLEWVNQSDNQKHRWFTQKAGIKKEDYSVGYIKRKASDMIKEARLITKKTKTFLSNSERDALGITNKSKNYAFLDNKASEKLKKYRSYKEHGMGELRSRINLSLPFSKVVL